MQKFSDRYGYTSPRSVLRKGEFDEECINSLCTCFDYLSAWLDRYDRSNYKIIGESYAHLEEDIWCFFWNQRRNSFWYGNGNHRTVATAYIESPSNVWYEKLNLIDYTLDYLANNRSSDIEFQDCVHLFVQLLNNTFIRLNLAFRVVNNCVVEITDEEEIFAIESALKVSDSVNNHMSGALKHLSGRPNPDYRNSIKESISAVEAICRDITGESDLGGALNSLEKKGVVIPRMLHVSFEKLYAYTNNKTTGIRHALMEDTESPGFDEAKFMLVACSAFINYIKSKRV